MHMKKITIHDVAKLAGVSKTTVSFYLNGMYDKMSKDTRKQIEEVIEKTGYQPSVVARSLNAKSNKLIGVIIGDVTNNFANKVIKGIESSCYKRGYKPILVSSDYLLENEKQYLRFLTSMHVDGFIVQPTVGFEEIYKSIAGDTPLVIFDSPIRDSKCHWVKTGSYQAVRDMVNEMVQQGYQEFVYVTADPNVLYTRKERYDGFMSAISERKLTGTVIVIEESMSNEELARMLMDRAPNFEKPVGVIVANNWLLKKVYLALEPFMHYIPEKMGLAGFDSLEWSELSRPSVTTIVQPSFEEGEAAATMLIDLIEEKELNQNNLVLSCYLNKKESTNRLQEDLTTIIKK